MHTSRVRAVFALAFALWAWLLASCTQSTPADVRPSGIQCSEAYVRRVVDGDTVEVALGNKVERVRYIGMNTPESVDPRRPVEPLGKEAAAVNRRLVEGKTVCLERDVSETDRYDRLLRYVWLGDTMINVELVRLGYAQAITYPPDVKYQSRLRAAEQEARAAHRGLWAAPPPGP